MIAAIFGILAMVLGLVIGLVIDLVTLPFRVIATLPGGAELEFGHFSRRRQTV